MKTWAKGIIISSLGISRLATSAPMKVSTPDWPPFYILESQDPLHKGIAWDILDLCAKKIDPQLSYESFPIKRMFKDMESGGLDLNIMSFKADRTKFVDYGKEVIFENTYAIWMSVEQQRVPKKLEDLNSLSIAQIVGLRPSDEFKKWFENRLKSNNTKETLVLNSFSQILNMLANNRIDTTAVSSPEIIWRAKSLGLATKIKNSGMTLQKQPYFFVISKESPTYKQNPSLLSQLDQCVRNLKRTGKWDVMRAFYNL